MKRFGEKATREALAAGAVIRYNDHFTLEAGYIGKYDLFRKLENGRGKWMAEDTSTGERFPITYAQAQGLEPIRPTRAQRLGRELGKKLLPRRA